MTIKTALQPGKVDILILGAGWTSTFLIPILQQSNITFAATTTTGRDGTYKFKFQHDESSDGSAASSKDERGNVVAGNAGDIEQYLALPCAITVLITFPLLGKNETRRLHSRYLKTHTPSSVSTPSETTASSPSFQFIQLGSTGIWTIPGQSVWVTRHSPYDTTDARALAEDELLSLGGCVLNLSGLWGGQRKVIHWIDRVAKTKEQLAGKKSLHMVHGRDVARGVVAVHERFKGGRWMLTDLIVYDWYELILGFAGQIDDEKGNDERLKTQIRWIGELMEEQDVRALPRSMDVLGRCYDSRDFWKTFGVMPSMSRL